MTYEAEMAQFLQKHNLPSDEGTYPPELMNQITIRAFDELFDRIKDLEDQLDDSIDIESFYKCEKDCNACEDALEKLRTKIKNLKETYES